MKMLERDFNSDKVSFKQNATYLQTISLRNSSYKVRLTSPSNLHVIKRLLWFHKAVSSEESLLQLCQYLKYKEAYMIVEKTVKDFRLNQVISTCCNYLVPRAWNYIPVSGHRRSCRALRSGCSIRRLKQIRRWRLIVIDGVYMQQPIKRLTCRPGTMRCSTKRLLYFFSAYPCLPCRPVVQVYRLRGYFWYKDAVLPSYRQSYDLVDNALTPLEEAALAHVLCSPDTSYGDVAGQMFVVQALIPAPQFALFQQLAAQGAQVVKYPRQGRPAKKAFRFSFVEGNIYLTWKGKFGNQGVGMGEVTSVVAGIGKWIWICAMLFLRTYVMFPRHGCLEVDCAGE